MSERLLRRDLAKLKFIANNDVGETSERASKTLSDFSRRGFVEPGPWKQEPSRFGHRVWTVRYFHLTPRGRLALQGADHV